MARKLVATTLAVIIFLGICPNAFAKVTSTDIQKENIRKDNYLSKQSISTYSVDTEFSLNFVESSIWVLDFDNNGWGPFNHYYVTINYISNTPTIINAVVTVELYIDDDNDGVYTEYDPSGGYSFQLLRGESLRMTLPYENEIHNYRLVFTNKTTSVRAASFSVISGRS